MEFSFAAGQVIEFYWPVAKDTLFGPGPLEPGQFFTLNAGEDGPWRAKLLSSVTDAGGTGLTVTCAVIGRYGDVSLVDPHPYPVHTPGRRKRDGTI